MGNVEDKRVPIWLSRELYKEIQLCAPNVHIFLDGCSGLYVSLVFLAGQVIGNV